MKKLYFFGAIVFGLSAVAQPTITSNSNPSTGTSFDYYNFSWNGDPGTTGANQTWDFSGLTGTATTMAYVTPASTPNGASFGSANICVNPVGSQTYQYNNNSASGQTIVGFDTPSGIINYTDPEIMLQLPCTYQTTWNDNLDGTISTGFTRSGTVSGNADAYGTLMLPTGTVSNVLRVTIQEDYTDYYAGNPVYMTSNTIYMFFVEGMHSPILALTHADIAGQVTEYGNYMDVSMLGLAEVNNVKELSIYPNPANDLINITLPTVIKSDFSIEITNVNGQVISRYTNPMNQVGISGLNSGIYFVTVKNGKDIYRTKIVKQ